MVGFYRCGLFGATGNHCHQQKPARQGWRDRLALYREGPGKLSVVKTRHHRILDQDFGIGKEGMESALVDETQDESDQLLATPLVEGP